MHCRSCEILIEDELKKVPGVTKAVVNHHKGHAFIHYENVLDDQAVQRAVERAGYMLGVEKRELFSKKPYDYKELGIAFFVAIVLYLVARSLGLFNLVSNVSNNYSSLPTVFLVGLTAGISTCMALVGGLVLGAAARFAEKHPNATGMEKFTPHLYFNLGRVVSYFILGGVIGYAGTLFQLSSSALGIMTVAVGIVMLLLGSQLIEIFPFLKKISFTLPTGISRFFGVKNRAEVEYSNKNAVIMGALTFFLPCGFTQAMQLYAISSGSALAGALTMGVFALGTAPGLLGVGGLTSAIKGSVARLFFKTVGVVVILLAIFNISNGLNLLGLNPAVSVLGAFTSKASAEGTKDTNVSIIEGVQVVRMRQVSGGYVPNKFTIRKGLPTRWVITSEDSYTCAASIISQKLGIRQGLQKGENIIEFTPTQTGTINFSCIMGMYTGSFTVVEGTSNQSTTIPANFNTQPALTNTINQSQTSQVSSANAQVITASYTVRGDISPTQFTVKVNEPVRFEIDAKEDGQGCMGSVALPGLTSKIEVFTKGKVTAFDFTPTKKGTYSITCAMGAPRGQIKVI